MNKTITTIFMVPTLGIPKGALRTLGFINAYQQDMDRDLDYGENKVIYCYLNQTTYLILESF